MRAGEDSNASITRSRSSPTVPLARSTMRYWTCLLSGMGDLSQQIFDDLYRLGLAPVALAERRVTHAAASVHEEGHRQSTGLPFRRRFLFRIEQHGEREPFLAQEVVDAAGALAVVHG